MFLAAHVCTFLVYISEQYANDNGTSVLFIARQQSILKEKKLDGEIKMKKSTSKEEATHFSPPG